MRVEPVLKPVKRVDHRPNCTGAIILSGGVARVRHLNQCPAHGRLVGVLRSDGSIEWSDGTIEKSPEQSRRWWVDILDDPLSAAEGAR